MRHWLLAAATLAALAPASVGAQADSTRLGRDVVPVFEAVRLVVDPAQPEFTGAVHVELKVSKPTATFSFHAEGPVISVSSPTARSGRSRRRSILHR